MKPYILSFAILPFAVHGQTTCDTIAIKHLEEITIVAAAQTTDATKTVYVPTKNQKSASSDGLTLLSRIGIPQLNVNPISETVKTADNQGVSLFINFHPASEDDIRGINPNDVKRIEYLDFPIDPRFERAQHVVNFILTSSTYGGYTKIMGKDQLMIHSGEGSLYSKFHYKRMEYDLIASGDHNHTSHIGTISHETYRLASGTIQRNSATETGDYRNEGLYSALRASWNKSDTLSVRNLISYRRINTPESFITGSVNFSTLYPPETFNSESTSLNNAFGWAGDVFAILGKGWTINGNWQTQLNANKTTANYLAGTTSIQNDADEDSWYLRGSFQANKSLSNIMTLFSSISSGTGRTRISYTGSATAKNKFRQSFSGLTVGVALRCQKLSGSIDGGYAIEYNYMNGKIIHDHYPFTHINLQYAPSHIHSMNIWFQYASFSPDATMKNPNILQQSELLYVAGNPDLKCSRNISASLSYVLFPNHKWQMSAYATLFRIAKRQIATYVPEGPNGSMLKKYQNNGDYNHGNLGASLTGKFIDGKLSFSLSPHLLIYRTTGSYDMAYCPFITTLSANYYLGKLFFNGYYDSGWSYIDGETAYLRKIPMSYSISAGMSVKGWNIQLSLINLFQSSWRISRDTIHTRWYDNTLTQFGSDYHRRISLSMTYTINYGKKINQSEELKSDKNISSSILH